MISFGYGQRTDAEIKLVTHSAFFTWVTRENRIWKMLEFANYWEPAEVLIFIQAADPKWPDLLKQIGIRVEDLPAITAAPLRGLSNRGDSKQACPQTGQKELLLARRTPNS